MYTDNKSLVLCLPGFLTDMIGLTAQSHCTGQTKTHVLLKLYPLSLTFDPEPLTFLKPEGIAERTAVPTECASNVHVLLLKRF